MFFIEIIKKVKINTSNQADTPSNIAARALVAEDVDVNQKIAQEMLEIIGCEVVIMVGKQPTKDSC